MTNINTKDYHLSHLPQKLASKGILHSRQGGGTFVNRGLSGDAREDFVRRMESRLETWPDVFEIVDKHCIV
ncbi:MAG: hypothetical protein KZQ93_19195 [Candidatus Thiodiazotropha sp. (ex Monitilora ramsayi)]|nr:hypothetical protein [Candidatus Thiodiazotropha sp. (ex Monitilora ramsayi)]